MTDGFHRSAALVIAALVLAACVHSRRAEPNAAKDTRPDSVVVRGRVVEDATGAPLGIVNIAVFLHSSPIVQVVTPATSEFELRVPRDSVELRIRRIGYVVQRRTLDASRTRLDTIPLELRMVSMRQYFDSLRVELQKPTAVTPCRPNGASGFSISGQLVHLVRDPSRLRAVQLSDLHGVPVEHVVDRDRCRAATEAIARSHRTTGEEMQVHLYRLGDKGWAAFDASSVGSHYWPVYILSADLSAVRKVLSF